MKTTVKVKNVFKSGKNQMLLLENTQWFDLDLEEDKEYSIEIKEIKSKRSINQNKLMWLLINKIAEIEKQDEMDIYCMALENANCSYDWLMGIPEIKESLLKSYRAVKITRYEKVNGHDLAVFKCYLGSSKFSVKEMNDLIEYIELWATNIGINVDLERELI